jgi:hypothetical protein
MERLSVNASRHVVVENDPRAFRGLLAQAANIVAGAAGEDVYLMVDSKGATCVIVFLSQDGQVPDALDAILMKHPSASLVFVSPDGNTRELKWLTFPSEYVSGVPFDELTVGLYTAFISSTLPSYGLNYAGYTHRLSRTGEGAFAGW